MKMFNPFRSKKKKREKLLLEEYNKGRVLQVDNNVDNKEYFSKENNPIPEETPEKVEEKPIEKEEIIQPREKTIEEKWIDGAIKEGYSLKQIKKTLRSSNYPEEKVRKMIKYYFKIFEGGKYDRSKQTKTENN